MPSSGAARAAEVGRAYEATLSVEARRRGAHFTPLAVAGALVARALERFSGGAVPTVLDPACGAGSFLVGAADELVRRGVAPEKALGAVHGVDLDPGAVDAARRALEVWAEAHGVVDATPQVRAGDGLRIDESDRRWDLVVGNPPFGGQLSRDTSRSAEERRAARDRWGAAAAGYLDTAALFVLAATELVGPDGVLAMILPRSVLSSRHGVEFRAALSARLRLDEVWLPADRVFEAQVDVCALLLARTGSSTGVEVSGGALPSVPTVVVSRSELDPDSWAPILAAWRGVPSVADAIADGVVGDEARCTAGFRDEYYALLDACRSEEPGGDAGRLVTSGAIDPLRCWWGDRPIKFGRRTWARPWLDLDELRRATPAVGRWVDALSTPKLLVATQTRSIEVAVDPEGDLVPVTPVLAVVPASPARLDHLAAALSGPVALAAAHRRLAGTGLSPTALRLTASVVAGMALPSRPEAWEGAVELLPALRDGSEVDRGRFGAAMCEAYAMEPSDARDELVEWWGRQLPGAGGRRSGRRPGPNRIDGDRGVVVT